MEESNVTKLVTKDATAATEEKVVPVNFTMTLAISQHRHVQATTSYFPVPGSSPDRVLDEMARSLERQRNKVLVTEIDEEIASRKKAIAKMGKKIAEIDEKNASEIEALKSKKSEARGKYDESYNTQKAETEKGGARTFDDTKPGVKAKLEPLVRGIKEFDDAIQKLHDDRAQGHAEYLKNVADFEEAIKEKLEEKEKLLALIGA